MFRHILFDADNTLIDTKSAQRPALELTMRAFGIPFDDDLFNRYAALSNRIWHELEQSGGNSYDILSNRFRELLPGGNFSAADMNRVYQENLIRVNKPIPYAREVCDKLRRKAPMSIVTNGMSATQRGKLERLAFAPYFTHLFISEEVGALKPDIRFFDRVMDALGRPEPSSVLIVGDSLTSDMQGGMNAGLATCWLNRGGEPVPPGYRIDYVIHSLRELEDIIPGTE